MIRRNFFPIIVLLLFASSAAAGNQSPEALDVSTSMVVVFKDGYCMFVKDAAGEVDSSGRAFMEGIPDSMVLGSFWAIPTKGRLNRITASQQIIPKKAGQETEKSLLFEFDPGTVDSEAEFKMIYFSPGIRWIPTYRIAYRKNGTADLVMQAEILNEAEDLNNVKVDLVVGVPNFRFKDVISPISLEATLRNSLRQAAPQLMSQSMSNVLFSQRAGEFRGEPSGIEQPSQPSVPTMPPELAGKGSQDLFVYHIPRLSLRAGERAAIPIITTEVPLRDIYTWDIQLSRSGAEGLPAEGLHTSPIRLLKNEIWHQIELTNKTDVPWTTGAAMVMDEYLPMAQELLTYTSVGGKCQLPLTVAVDIRGTYLEKETERKLNAIHYNGHTYTRISKKGTLRVTNFKKDPACLMTTCSFGGNTTEASDEGHITVNDFVDSDWKNYRGDPALNGHSIVNWELTLKPGKTREVTVDYYYYQR